MKAIAQVGYGSPDVLALREVEMPRVEANGVPVRVHAASVNALDWHTTRGMPYLIRTYDGLRSPRHTIRGVDLAGRVEITAGRTSSAAGSATTSSSTSAATARSPTGGASSPKRGSSWSSARRRAGGWRQPRASSGRPRCPRS